MIICSSRRLEKALARNELAPWEKVKYLIIPAAISPPIAFLLPRLVVERPDPPFLLFRFLFWLVTVFVVYDGIKQCFRTNNRFGGDDFFARFAALSVPVMIKLVLIVLPIGFIVSVILGAFASAVIRHSDSPDLYMRITVRITISALGPIVVYTFYALLNQSFERLGHLLEDTENTEV